MVEEEEVEEEACIPPTPCRVLSPPEVAGQEVLCPLEPLTTCQEVSPVPDPASTPGSSQASLLLPSSRAGSHNSQEGRGARPLSPLLSTPG